jgi:thiamine biosynthesis lipoprotein
MFAVVRQTLCVLIAIFSFFCLTVSHPVSAATSKSEGGWHSDSAAIMGTNIVVEVWAATPRKGERAIEAVFAEMERINQLMSPYIESSELSAINRHAALRSVMISPELYSLIERTLEMSEMTNGAFDITFASVGYLFNYRDKLRPDDETVSALKDAINYRFVELEPGIPRVKFNHPDVKIDLGGIAKGYAVDNAIRILKKHGIKHGLVTAGGDTKLLGDRRGRDWMVGIRDPRNSERQAVLLPLSDTAMSTSGDYERYFEENGTRYHHILSPRTGESATGVQSVSIISDSATNNDALSTAVFVLGVEQGLRLINQLDNVDAIIMDAERKMHYSDGLLQQN